MTDPIVLAQLRHLYQSMVNGAVRDTASAKRMAEGLLALAIEALERATPPAAQQAAPKAAPGEPSDTSFSQFLSDVMTAAGLVSHGKQCKALGDRLADMVMRLRAAPQQEAQEPVAWLSPWRADQVTTDYDAYGERGIPLYTAPQPAPAPLSDDAKDAARWRMAALIGKELMLRPDRRTHATAVKAYMDATHSGSGLTGAVDAALAAQGGKDA